MFITAVNSRYKFPVIICPVETINYKKITKSKYSFNWKIEKNYSVYKIFEEGKSEILGLVSFEFFDEEYRIEIRLMAVLKEQIGRNKTLDRIAGNLFAFASKLSIIKYGALAAVSLVPKTELGQYYMDKYGFEQAADSLFLEGLSLLRLIYEYDHD